VEEAEKRLLEYRKDPGYKYLDYKPLTPPDQLFLEDLAVTLLVNSQARLGTAMSMVRPVNIGHLPDVPLEGSSEEDRVAVAKLITEICSSRGYLGASTVTKILHKKRPRLVPILDNQAIFGAYMNPDWGPGKHSSAESIGDFEHVKKALDW